MCPEACVWASRNMQVIVLTRPQDHNEYVVPTHSLVISIIIIIICLFVYVAYLFII